MIIVIIHWKIRKGNTYREDFFRFWRGLNIQDRSELIGEFLSEPLTHLAYSSITLAADNRFDSYFNVGIWSSEDAFKRNVIDPFVSDNPVTQDFEFEYRDRMILQPDWWRIGEAQLPDVDHLPWAVR